MHESTPHIDIEWPKGNPGEFGLDEMSPVSTLGTFSHLIQSMNFRSSRDGKKLEKRDGLEQLAQITGSLAIYGYGTYYNVSSQFCQIAVTSAAVWRKVASGAWTSIHTWSTALSHPVSIMEIQGRIYIISDVDNIMLTSGGTKVTPGIVAPTTLPTVAESFDATLLDEDMADIADWTDADAGNGVSSQVTYDSKSCLKLLNTGVVGDYARRYRDLTNISTTFVIEMSAYFDLLGMYQNNDHFRLNVYNGRIGFQMIVDKNDIYIYSGNYWIGTGTQVNLDRWTEIKVYVNSDEPGEEYCELFIDGESKGEFYCSAKSEEDTGRVSLWSYGDTVATIAYVDSLKIGSTTGGVLTGKRRYALTYYRSGNYPAESNPIKSAFGTVTFSGTGLNDLTKGGTYTGIDTKNIKVQIDGTGATDTFKWSDDNGATWRATTVRMVSTNYLSYGIEIYWAATTGHTSTDNWTFIAYSFSADPVHQRVTLSSIPTSSDSQVDRKRIYRTTSGGTTYYLVGDLPNAETTLADNIPDSHLGVAMEEDRDIPPEGKFSCWWDERLWIFDVSAHMGYYSEIRKPDEFDISERFISFLMGETNDPIMGVVPLSTGLYVFKRKSKYVIKKKTSGLYGRYDLPEEGGLAASYSLVEANGLACYLSDRGLEAFNGENDYDEDFGFPVQRTIETIDWDYPDYITSVHHRLKKEIWISLRARTGGNSATTIIFDYVHGRFYFFSWHKTPSCLVQARDSQGKMQTYIGTTDGYIFKTDTGDSDDGTAINGYCRFNWLKFPIHVHSRLFQLEYEAPDKAKLLTEFYVNLGKDIVWTDSYPGNTPSTTDIELRRSIDSHAEISQRGIYHSVVFRNNESYGSSVKICNFMMRFLGLTRKEMVKAD